MSLAVEQQSLNSQIRSLEVVPYPERARKTRKRLLISIHRVIIKHLLHDQVLVVRPRYCKGPWARTTIQVLKE